MRFLRQSLTGLFLVSLTLGLLLYGGYLLRASIDDRMAREAKIPQVRERVFSVNVLTATPQTLVPLLTAYGEVQSRRTLDLRAASSGTIIELADEFVEGGQVRIGQVLARIDPSSAQSALDRAKSDVLDAEAEIRDAARVIGLAKDELAAAKDQAKLRERAFERQTNLKSRGVGTEASVETTELAASSARQAVLARRQSLAQAEARGDQAATRLNRAKIAAAEAERQVDNTVLKAEFSGRLSEVSVVQGGLVTNNERLARLVDGQSLEVAFRISTAQYVRLLDDAGTLRNAPIKVALSVFGVDLTATGQISRDSAQVGSGQTGRLVFATLINARGLKPGDFVTVEIEEQPLDFVVSLPATALDPSGNVLAIGPGNRLEGLPVTVLRRQGDDVLVRGPDIAGRQIVTARSPLLGAGIKVKPLGEPEAGEQTKTEMIDLSDDRRAKLVAFVEANNRMPKDVKDRLLTRLKDSKVPATMVERLESRIGG